MGRDALFWFLENRSTRAGYIISTPGDLSGAYWTQKASPEWASKLPRLWEGLIIAGNCRGEVRAFRASDGAPQWKLNVKGCVSSIGSSGDTLFVGVQEGTVYAFDLTGASAAPSTKKLVLTGTVTAISQVYAKPPSVRNWAVTIRVEKVKAGKYSQPEFTFTIHSPALAGLAVGRRCTIEAAWTGQGYIVDDTRRKYD